MVDSPLVTGAIAAGCLPVAWAMLYASMCLENINFFRSKAVEAAACLGYFVCWILCIAAILLFVGATFSTGLLLVTHWK